MPKNMLNTYIWLVDTIRSHGALTREELNRLWVRSPLSNGIPMARRTFYNYRAAIEELFKINIECNSSTFQYYIDDNEDEHKNNVTDWMLNTASISNVLSTARDISHRIFLEDVPSAREFLSPVMSALRENHVITFLYSPYTRSGAGKKVVLEPYFLKIFRQRWYITGRNTVENTIKTYALDRMSALTITTQKFNLPPDFDPETYFRDAFGIVFSQGEVRKVALKVDKQQAKYLRALPLHHSQSEMVDDNYSIFHYNLRLTPDLVQELMSFGPSVTVLSPPELRAMMITRLSETLKNYQQ